MGQYQSVSTAPPRTDFIRMEYSNAYHRHGQVVQ